MSLRTVTRARASALIIGGASLFAATSPGRTQANASISIAAIPIEGTAEAFYAKELGLFTKVGLEANIVQMASSAAIAGAIAANAIDIGYLTLDTLAAAHQKGIPLIAIAPVAEYLSPATLRNLALVLPANSAVHQAGDLNGKIVAVPGLNGLNQTATRAWIDQNGGDSSTVKFVEIPFPAMPAALEAGRIDAASLVEPFLDIAKKNGRVLAYGEDAIAKHFLPNAWCRTSQWAKGNPDLVNRFVIANHEAAVWANKNPKKSVEFLELYTKTDPAIIAATPRVRFAEQLTAPLIQPLIDASAKYNGFSTFPAEDLMYTPSR